MANKNDILQCLQPYSSDDVFTQSIFTIVIQTERDRDNLIKTLVQCLPQDDDVLLNYIVTLLYGTTINHRHAIFYTILAYYKLVVVNCELHTIVIGPLFDKMRYYKPQKVIFDVCQHEYALFSYAP